MVAAKRRGVPFWPAASILDTPNIIFVWEDIAAEAERLARPALERRATERATTTTH